MRHALLVALLLLGAQDSALDKTARRVADGIADNPKITNDLFHKTFLQKVPLEQVTRICHQLHGAHGTVSSVIPAADNIATSGKFTFIFDTGSEMVVTLAVSTDTPPQIIGLWFGPPTSGHSSIDDIVARLKKLPGTVSFRTARLGERLKVLHELNPDTQLAVGSTFKLYILGAIVQDAKPWTDVVKLRPELKSHPSGSLHKWPDGSPVTVHTLAAQMISVSDNTATDHLLHYAGRRRVEAMMKTMGNAKPERSMPFLTTLELFKLKSDKELRAQYLAADTEGRRKLLAGPVRNMPRDKVTPYGKPTAIDTLEWFASAADLCRLMSWFHGKDDRIALEIMAINPGMGIPRERFSYAGFKGGSEPGVLNLTFLLRTKDGTAYALSAGWNDKEDVLDKAKFTSLVQSAINLLAKEK
ncbi:MAG: serine hydrolase [Planctomycetota bacterium]|jgi:hypothetical protein